MFVSMSPFTCQIIITLYDATTMVELTWVCIVCIMTQALQNSMLPNLNAEREAQEIVSQPMLLWNIPCTEKCSRDCCNYLRPCKLNLQSCFNKRLKSKVFQYADLYMPQDHKSSKQNTLPGMHYHNWKCNLQHLEKQ